MKKNDFLNELTKRLGDILPTGLGLAKADIEKNFHAVLQNTFAKLELVTREEFDAQTKVLARTREKLTALEEKVKTLEQDNR